jgi:hypothetical protein
LCPGNYGVKAKTYQQTADSSQQTAASRQQTADSRQYTADNRQQTSEGRQQKADSRQQIVAQIHRNRSGPIPLEGKGQHKENVEWRETIRTEQRDSLVNSKIS